MIAAKADSVETTSNAIIVSFHADWHKPLLNKKFSAVIRKRIPRTSVPEWLYFHVNAPVSAICGRAKIKSFDEISVESVHKKAEALALTEVEISDYLSGSDTIGIYQLTDIQFATPPITRRKICSMMIYHPPQSFVFLSKEAKGVLDSMTEFTS